MHGTAPALALAALLLSPAVLGSPLPGGPAGPALPAWPAAPAPALPAPPPVPAPFPLALSAPAAPATLVVGVPATLAVVVNTTGLAGSGVQPPVERRVRLNATLDSGDAAAVQPDPVVLAPGASQAGAAARFTPNRLGPLGIALAAAWETLPGNATLALAAEVVKDDLAVEGLAAGAPDADLDLALAATLRSGHLAAEPLDWHVEATHVPVNGTEALRWVAAAGRGRASPAGEPWAATVRARYGPGAYTFAVHASGARLEAAAATLAVDVPEVRRDRGSAGFTLVVEDHPTTLRLASDSVNGDGKPKAPGQALITRVVVGDANGLRDVRRVTFTYARDDAGALQVVHARSVEGLGGATETALEDRFDLAPMKDGAYVCTVTAEGTGVAQVRRTFVITESPPEAALRLDAAEFLPARAGAVRGTLVVRDANFGTGPLDATDVTELGPVALRLFKGSAAVQEAGWAVAAAGLEGPAPLVLDLSAEGSRSTRWGYRAVDGRGEVSLPVEVRIPEGAAPGTHRLSISASNTTLASAAFNVTALPRVIRLAVGPAPPGGAATVEVEAAPAQALAALELRTPWGAVLRAGPGEVAAADGAWRWTAAVPVPRPWDDEAPAELTALADLGDGRVVVNPQGQAVNARAAPLAVANAPPRLEAQLRLGGVAVGGEAWVHPHASLDLAAEVQAFDDNAVAPDLRDELGPIEAEVRDWAGQLVRFEVDGDFAPAGTRLAVQPLDVEPGRYALRLRVRDDDGAAAERTLAVHVGLHFRLAVQAAAVAFAPDANGTLRATVPLRNLGNAPAGSIAVLAEGLPPGAAAAATLELANGTRLRGSLEAGFVRFAGAPRLVEPSEWARVHLEVDARHGVAAGRFDGRIVVAGEAA